MERPANRFEEKCIKFSKFVNQRHNSFIDSFKEQLDCQDIEDFMRKPDIEEAFIPLKTIMKELKLQLPKVTKE